MFNFYNLADFVKTFRGKIHSPRVIQRRVVWKPEDIMKYLMSMNSDQIWCHSIIIIDVRKCLDHCKVHGNKNDVRWFQKFINNGHYYLVLDGQNRTDTMLRFFDNDFTLTGEFVDQDGNTISVDNVFLKDMPNRLRDKFMTGTRISVAFIEDATRARCRRMFKNYNSGVALNRMENRDCSFGAGASWVREISDEYETALRRVVNDTKWTRMNDYVWITNMAMHLMKDYHSSHPWKAKDFKNFDETTMDMWYEMGEEYLSLNDAHCPYLPQQISRCENIFETVFNIVEEQKIYKTRSGAFADMMMWATLYTVEWAYDNNYIINDPVLFFNTLYNIDKKLIEEAEVDYGADLKLYRNDRDKYPEPKKSQYYSYWASTPKKANDRARRINALINEVKKPNNLKKLSLFLSPAANSAGTLAK
tara:strand:+ start:163 stop:1416 length:1254 start_codon:yes stop_codon:yes gene_type:complete